MPESADTTLGSLYQTAKKRLREALSERDTPDLDARLLVSEATRIASHHIIADPNRVIDFDQANSAKALIERRANGEPVARILGRQDFLSRTFRLNAATLVPRPETEEMVEAILARIKTEGKQTQKLNILDLGTGSGAIVISLLCELPDAFGLGVDISHDALAMAEQNARDNGVFDRCRFLLSDYGAAVQGTFDVIISNPPYIGEHERQQLAHEVLDHEPERALFAADQGLAAYQRLIPFAKKHLTRNGFAAFEHGYEQQKEVLTIADKAGFMTKQGCKDMAGQPRFVFLQ